MNAINQGYEFNEDFCSDVAVRYIEKVTGDVNANFTFKEFKIFAK